MPKNNYFDYTAKDIIYSLKNAGISKSDDIFIHSNTGFFGRLQNAKSQYDYYLEYKKTILSVIGNLNTIKKRATP